MNYTDKYFFSFPMKIYDGFSLRQAIKKEEDTSVSTDGEWVEGWVDLPAEEIDGCFDVFSKGRTVSDVVEEGFDGCIILTRTKGEFECTWTRKEFKAKYNAFMEKYEAYKKAELNEAFDKLEKLDKLSD